MRSRIPVTLIVGTGALVLVAFALLLPRRRENNLPPKEEPGVTAEYSPEKRAAMRSAVDGSNLPPAGTNAYTRWRAGTLPEVAPTQLADYLLRNRRNAASLLGAFRSTGDKSFLQEAMQNYPDEPRVALSALLEGGAASGDRQKWLETLRVATPDNSLANFLSAAEYLHAGNASDAIKEMLAGSSKPYFEDYWVDATQNAEEAYRAAGYSEAEAKMAAASMRIPEFSSMRALDQGVLALAKTLGDPADQGQLQSLVQSGLALGQMLADPNARQSIGQYAMGMEIEQQFLRLMDPTSTVGDVGQTVNNQLDQISQQLQLLKSLTQRQGDLLAAMSDQDLIDYADHQKVFGGLQALQWLANRQENR
jgi:hypothetical protein